MEEEEEGRPEVAAEAGRAITGEDAVSAQEEMDPAQVLILRFQSTAIDCVNLSVCT